jgi:hypothetical protein
VITVVTGLPRSGTSLLMQMLHAGGFPVLQDEQRPADAHNTRGYFEYAAVKNLRNDASWLPEARSKAVKVVAPLGPRLPSGERYRFIMVERDLAEVLASQRHMLGPDAPPDAPTLAAALQKSLDNAARHISEVLHSPLLRIRYAELLRSREESAVAIADFVESSLDIAAMVNAIDPDLYRQRQSVE